MLILTVYQLRKKSAQFNSMSVINNLLKSPYKLGKILSLILLSIRTKMQTTKDSVSDKLQLTSPIHFLIILTQAERWKKTSMDQVNQFSFKTNFFEKTNIRMPERQELEAKYKFIIPEEDSKNNIHSGMLKKCLYTALAFKRSSLENQPWSQERWAKIYYPIMLKQIVALKIEQSIQILENEKLLQEFRSQIVNLLDQEDSSLKNVIGFNDMIRDELLILIAAFFNLETACIKLTKKLYPENEQTYFGENRKL